MTDRVTTVRLRAEVADFKREISGAAGSLSDLATKAGGAEKVASTSLGRLAQSAKLQREEWTTVGTALLGVGGATTAIGVAALKTGVSYNSLQQTSRAALRTLTGSAEAANAQMDKLDAFAKTSPFAKDVFIRAQQQMLGFGIESRKVIPYLSAINDAVAATGGSNQDISELTRIFSQVQAASKITAVDLMQFGQRGVDAATLIGSQMGKTGAQIREEISDGTLDAGAALDALAAGMSQRFEGASANVKNTFAGAMDRVKAAWRDLSAELAAPLVGPEGGGLATAGLNALADTMRSFQDAPGWVKGGITAAGGLAGATALAAGTIALGLPRFIEFRQSLDALAQSFPGAAAKIRTFGAALGPLALLFTAVAVAATGYAAAQANARAMAESLAGTLDAQTGAVTRNTNAWVTAELTKSQSFGINNTQSMIDAARELGVSTETVTRAYLGQPDAIREAKAAAQEYLAQQNILNDTSLAHSSLAQRFIQNIDDQSARMEVAAEIAATKAEVDEEAARATDGLATAAAGAATAEDGLAAATDAAVKAAEAHVAKLDQEIARLDQVIESQRRAMGIKLGALEAESRFQAAIDDASAALEKNGATLDLNTEKGRANQAALSALAEAGWDNVEALLAQDPSGRTARDAMSRTREEFIRAATAARIGADEANRLADELGMVPTTVTTMITANAQQAILEAEKAQRAVFGIPTSRHVTISGSLTSEFEAAQRAANPGSLLRRAAGGPIFGPGTSTSDSIPAWLSTGEYVINAASTAKYRPIIEAINAGRYAGGGQVRAQSYMSTSAASQGSGRLPSHITLVDESGGILTRARVVAGEVIAGEMAGVTRAKRARGII